MLKTRKIIRYSLYKSIVSNIAYSLNPPCLLLSSTARCLTSFDNTNNRSTNRNFILEVTKIRQIHNSNVVKDLESEGEFAIKNNFWDHAKKDLSPKKIYKNRVEKGILRFDNFQDSVVNRLDELYFRILKRNNDPNNNNQKEPQVSKPEKKKWLQNLSESLFKTKTEEKTTDPTENNIEQQLSVYLFGTVGTGKTMLMDIFHDALPNSISKRRVHFHAFMIEVHERIHRLKKENRDLSDPIVPLAAGIAQEARILCFDELQVTDIADAMILRRLFDELFRNGISIITTSNRHPDELYKNGLQRKSFLPCIEVLKKECQVIDLNSGVDYRKLAVDSKSFFFSPLNKESADQMNELFELFTQGKPVSQETIKFLGRQLIVPKSSNGVARFDFKDLCLQPLNAADYLKIAVKYHSIFLDNIPQIGSVDLNTVRRFITLLDALYENKNTLICSAECDLKNLFSSKDTESEESMSKADRLLLDDLGLDSTQLSSSLFTGEEEKFALARALSRLTEMQSFKWVQSNPKAPVNHQMMDI